MMITDSLGRVIEITRPKSIISLVPSWTEFICDIGAFDKLIGRTKFCIQPPKIKKIPEIGGTKNPNVTRILELEPELIIANKEENKQYDINKIRSSNIEVFVTSATTVVDALIEMKKLENNITGKKGISQKVQNTLETDKNRFEFTFLYFVWFDPLMVAGNNTYISKTLEYFGGKNVFENQIEERYPTVDRESLETFDPEIIFLPDEPFEFKEKHRHEIQEIFPHSSIHLVDGKTFSWYGKRLSEVSLTLTDLVATT